MSLSGARCTQSTSTLLFAVYVVSISAALTNPANVAYDTAYMLAQGANVVTLALLARCQHSKTEAIEAGILGIATLLRATIWKGGTRWDSLLVWTGMFLVLKHAASNALPAGIHHRAILFTLFSCLVMPVIVVAPWVMTMPNIDAGILKQAASFAMDAYAINPTGPPNSASITAAAWTLYDGKTSTRAGITRVMSPGSMDQIVYVYFAGTSDKRNVMSDVNILNGTVPSDWGCNTTVTMRTHRGFTDSFGTVATQMLTALKAEVTSTGSERIVFCGHSLGGALATLAGLYVACSYTDVRNRISVVTFGSPQVGDGAFVAFFNATIPVSIRVANPIDPVPRLLNAQLTHVKGYYPVGILSYKTLTRSHNMDTYLAAVDTTSRAKTVFAAFLPAVLGAIVIGTIITYQVSDM